MQGRCSRTLRSMRRACLVLSPMVLSIAYVACVGDDPPLSAVKDAGTASDSTSPETSVPEPDGAVDAGRDAAVDAPDPCAVPPAGAGVACTSTSTCPRGQNCCQSAANGQRDCVPSATDCTGTSIPVQCAAKNHCADGAEICCLEANPSGTVPNGSCPAVVDARGSACSLPFSDAGCSPGQIRLCGPSETCPAGTSCRQIDVNVGTGTPYRTGACL